MLKKYQKIKHLVMYSRIDEECENQESLFAAQEEVMFAFAEKHNLSIVAAHREIALGSWDYWSRPVLQEAFHDARKTAKHAVVVSNMDRYSELVGMAWEQYNERTKQVICCEAGLQYDEYIMMMKAAFKEEEWRLRMVAKGLDHKDERLLRTEAGKRRNAERFEMFINAYDSPDITLEQLSEQLFSVLKWTGDWWHSEEHVVEISQLLGITLKCVDTRDKDV
jgi:hypothetical protein